MLIDFQISSTSIIIRVKVRQDNTGAKPGQGFTTLTNTSSGLIVAAIADVEATTTAYTSAASKVQTIATLGTFAAPTSGDCRLAPVDTTNHPGIMELQLDNTRYAVTNAKSVLISITGVSGMADCDVTIPLRSVNPYSASFGLSLAKTTNITGLNDIAATAIVSSGAITTSGGAVTTTTNLTNLPSIPANWITAAGINAAALNGKGDWLLASSYTAPPTAAANATAVWTDTTAGDFTTNTSPGKIIFSQLGGAFSTTSSSIFSTASLANAPTGGSAPTVGQIATAVWQDTTAGDFTVASSIGKSLFTSGAAPGASGGIASHSDVTALGSPAQASTALSTAVWTSGLASNISGGAVALASQIPANFTTATFASAGVFATAALQNAPSGGGGNVTVGGYASGQDPATILFAAFIEAGVTFLMALRAIAADSGGNLTEASDHSTSTVSALGNSSTPRLSSANTSTTRTVTPTLS